MQPYISNHNSTAPNLPQNIMSSSGQPDLVIITTTSGTGPTMIQPSAPIEPLAPILVNHVNQSYQVLPPFQQSETEPGLDNEVDPEVDSAINSTIYGKILNK